MRLRVSRGITLLLVVLALLLAGCQSKSEKLPDMVVFIADDHGRLDSEPFGSRVARTPELQRMADEGLTLSHVFVASPDSAPSRSALFSAQYPQKNGIEAGNDSRHFKNVTSMLHHFTDLGYEVAAFGNVAQSDGNRNGKWDYGFTHQGSRQLDLLEVEAFLQNRDSTRPLLLFLGTQHPGVPWTRNGSRFEPDKVDLPARSIDTPQARINRSRYLEDVLRMDEQLGFTRGLVDRYLGKETFVMFTSDGGAEWPFGKWNLYDASVRVATFVVWPGRAEAGLVSPSMVGWIDILPTLLDIAGGEADSGRDGRSFKPALTDNIADHREIIFTTHTGDGALNVYPMRMARSRHWLYIRNLHSEFRYVTQIDGGTERWSDDFWDSWTDVAKTDPDAAAIVTSYHQRPSEELYYIATDPHSEKNRVHDLSAAEALEDLRAELDRHMEETMDQETLSGTPVYLEQAAQPGPNLQ